MAITNVVSTLQHTTGKYFFEVLPNTISTEGQIGIVPPGALVDPGSVLNSAGGGVGLFSDVFVDTVSQAQSMDSADNFAILVEVDLDTGTITFNNQNTGIFGPFTITTGVPYEAIARFDIPSDDYDIDFLGSTVTPTAGFVAWDTPAAVPSVVVSNLTCETHNVDTLACSPSTDCLDFDTTGCDVEVSLVINPSPPCIPFKIETAPPTVDLLDPYEIVVHTMGTVFTSTPYADFVSTTFDIKASPGDNITVVLNFSNSNTLTLDDLVQTIVSTVVQTPLIDTDGNVVQAAGTPYTNLEVRNNEIRVTDGTVLCGSILLEYLPVNEVRFQYLPKSFSGEYCYLLTQECTEVTPFIVRVGLD